jgi:hypothetical protein
VIGRKRPLSLPAEVNVEERNESVIMVDSDFEFDGRLYTITFVSEDFVRAFVMVRSSSSSKRDLEIEIEQCL